MKKLLKIVLPIVAVLGAIAISAILFVTRPKVEHQQVEIKVPLVSVSVAKAESLNIPVYTRGTVAPAVQIHMVSEVSGQVLELSPNFANGGFFTKGEVLVKVDPIEYEVNIKRAEAAKAQAYQAFLQAEAEKKARSRSGGTGQNKLASFEIQYRQAEAQYLAANAELEAIKMQRDRTTIRAPFDGRVLMAGLNIGQYLRPGVQMGVIYAVDVAEVRLPLSDRQLSLVDVPVRLTAEEQKQLPEVVFTEEFAGKTFTWKGQIVRAEGGVDERNRLLYLVARVPEPYAADPSQPGRRELVAGSFVEAKISGRKFERVFVIPRRALRNGNQIWVVGDDGRLSKRDIGILYKAKDTIYVSTGIDDGEQVVLSQLDIAVEGMKVRTQIGDGLPEVEESNARKNPFASATPVQPAISGPFTQTANSVTLNVDAAQARDIAAKAKKYVDGMDDAQKEKIKQSATQLSQQLGALQSALKQPQQRPKQEQQRQEQLKAAAQPVAEPAPDVAQPELAQEPAVVTPGQDASMSPLAAQLEQDIARQAQQPEPAEPAVVPEPSVVAELPVVAEPAAGTQSPTLLADSSRSSSSIRVISTVAAPKPLVEASQ